MTNPSESPHYVMGVGASAGGLEALQEMLRSFPQNLPLSILIAQHLAPNYKSLLAELLERGSSLRVRIAEDGAVPEVGIVHVCPPNADIIMENGAIRLLSPGHSSGPKPSVDALLSSIAASCGDRAIGVLLSGTGSDGTYGMREIHSVGGLTIAQDPSSAKYDSMPRSAIEAGVVDRTVAAAHVGRSVELHIEGSLEGVDDLQDFPRPMLQRILSALHSQMGIDFTSYKESTLQRQISRRMAVLQIADQSDYLTCLLADSGEAKILGQNMLVSVTSFYRDPEVWETLSEELAQRLPNSTGQVRVWVAGCATGEEAYTLAMVIARTLGYPANLDARLKVFATDLDEAALEFGRRGVYPAVAAQRLPEDLREQYLSQSGTEVRVDRRIKECIVFARHNLATDPPFIHMDLVSCRNVLIYFDNNLQEAALEGLHYALNPEGLLMLGTSEGVGRMTESFKSIHAKKRLFARSERPDHESPKPELRPRVIQPRTRTVRRTKQSDEVEVLRDALLRDLVPPSLVVNESAQLIQVLGDLTRYCRYPEGSPDTSLSAIVRPFLTAEVKRLAAMNLVSDQPVSGSWIDPGDGGPSVRVVVRTSTSSTGRFQVLSFLEATSDLRPRTGSEDDEADLRQELDSTREALQSTIEELETSNEELQAMNEEMMASTEELQASNEELETINEELQASNEELSTLNEELQIRTKELADTNLDLRNIQEAITQALVIVDKQHRVTRFSPRAVRLFALVPEDVGIPVNRIATTVELPNLTQMIDRVIGSGVPEILQASASHADYQVQISPWRDQSEQVGGAVLSINDVTGAQATKRVADNAAEDLRLVTTGLGAAVWTRRRSDGELLQVGPGAADLLGVPRAELLADPSSWGRNVLPEDGAQANQVADPARPERLRYRVQQDGREHVILDISHGPSATDPDTVLGTLRDISEVIRRQEESADDHGIVEAFFAMPGGLALVLDRNQRITRAGTDAEAYIGLPASVLIGRRLTEVCMSGEDEALRSWLQDLFSDELNKPVVARFMRRDGSPRELEITGQSVTGGQRLLLARDITDNQNLMRQLRADSDIDRLTGLASRSSFEAALSSAIGRAARSGRQLAVLWLDLDGFKDVNDRLGHHVGDLVLSSVGQRLKARLRIGDQMGRVGGDEFCMLLEDFRSLEQVDLAASRLLDTLREPLASAEGLAVSGSLGIAIFPDDAQKPSALMRAADSAMYSAKSSGGDRYQYFKAVMHQEAETRAEQRAEISESLRRRAFTMHYQPIVDLSAQHRLWGVEALIRRKAKDGSLRPAAEFIDVAELSGQIRQLGALALRLLARDLRQQLPTDLIVAANISPTELADPDFPKTLRDSGIGEFLHRMVIEVTERTSVDADSAGLATLDMMRRMGARVAVDDYGSGWSNLDALARLAPGIIKVDQRLVALATQGDQRGLAFLNSANLIGRAFGASVVAEGIETEEQLDLVRKVGIELAQGYLFGHPGSIPELLQRWGQ